MYNAGKQAFYTTTRRVGLAESSRILLFHLMKKEFQEQGGETEQEDLAVIERERCFLRERVSHKPGTVVFLERVLGDLYDDARRYLLDEGQYHQIPPPGCPYTLSGLLEIEARPTSH
ncbi:MAG: DUF29 family protein [Candidatus Thiothrix moscowensis]|nr:DUF29 family protein [Candidatus Thiothrix moscowensis]